MEEFRIWGKKRTVEIRLPGPNHGELWEIKTTFIILPVAI